MGGQDKASAGQPFRPPPAEVWNGMVAAGDQYRQTLISSTPTQKYKQRQTDIIKVRNDTGADRSAGDVVRISGLVLGDLTAEHPWVKGVAVTTGTPFGIITKPIADGKFGELQVSGACLATVDIQSTSDQFANTVAASYVLESGPAGPLEILYAPASTGEQTCLVVFRSGAAVSSMGKTDGSGMTAASGDTMGSGTVALQYLSGSTLTAGGGSVTAYNWSDEAVAANTKVRVAKDANGVWWLAGVNC